MINLHYKLDDKTSETRVLPIKKVLDFKRSRYCQFLIADTVEKGLILAIDGKIETTEASYMEYHTQLLANVPRDKDGVRALVLGSGEGVCSALLSSYGYEVDAVDIDGVLVKSVEEHLRSWSSGIPKPNKIVTYIYDAFDFLNHLESEEKEYDVVVFNLNEPNVASEDCYSDELILEIRKVMKKDAVFCYQNGSLYADSLLDPIINGHEHERLQETISETAEWKFGAVRFKGE